MTSDVPPQELLAAVVDHERAIWTARATIRQIDLRNRAARAAVEAGWSAEDIARAVHVKPGDVQRWARASS
jgi:ribosome-binding protein aMBF1 (putative translation factor)